MSQQPAHESTRRGFLASSAAFGVGLIGIRPAMAKTYQANSRLRIGVIGVANRGRANLDGVTSEEITALCDVDTKYLDAAGSAHPQAQRFRDFRRMLDKVKLDAVVISTPDHTHAPATAMALRRGLDVYCEKPLTHTVFEARAIADLANRHERVTQMGTQIHAGSNYRRVVEAIRAGVIGEVSEVHVWCAGGYSGGDRPTDRPPVPANLDWDLWLGPAPERPYHPAYVPHQWRGWWDFGNGTLGDMACHHMDLPFWALDLQHPLTVEAEGPPVHSESTPTWLIVRYTFPERLARPAVTLTWYNGDRRPPQFAQGLLPDWGNGTLFVGNRGMLLADYGKHVLLPAKDFAGYVPPTPSIPESLGHYEEWIAACKSRGPTTCNFDYAGRLTEAVLLGNVAYRSGARFEWDHEALHTRGAPEAEKWLRRAYRRGWSL
jgi:predicted dehydrogenase